MIDIADRLVSARGRSRWVETVDGVLESISQATGLRLSWEKSAGEDWASFLRDDSWTGMVSVSVSLGVTNDPGVAEVMRSEGVAEVIVVDAYQDVCMRCDLAVLKETFKYDHGWETVVDPARFSAEDLWWTTI